MEVNPINTRMIQPILVDHHLTAQLMQVAGVGFQRVTFSKPLPKLEDIPKPSGIPAIDAYTGQGYPPPGSYLRDYA